MRIYFDNAATSWPKPESVIESMINFNSDIGSNPGRSGHHLSVEAGRVLYDVRDCAAELFNVDDPLRISLTSNVTHSLNIVLRGYLGPGDHVITSSMEHNSVMRPLRDLEQRGLELSVIACNSAGQLDPLKIKQAIKSNTKLIVLTHASNVTGTLMPVHEVGALASEEGITFCVDAAQTAGCVPIDVERMNIDILCFTGHKGLMGPMGTGGFYIKDGLEKFVEPLMSGGTGSLSEYEKQPDFMPDKYESGTLNALGFAGLASGIRFVLDTGVDVIRKKEDELLKYFMNSFQENPAVTLFGPVNPGERTSVVSFNIDGVTPSDTAFIFDEEYGILSRPGLHCAPSAHRTLGTFPDGTNRFSFGYFNTFEEIDIAVKAIEKITGDRCRKVGNA